MAYANPVGRLYPVEIERFWAAVEKHKGSCWLWSGRHNRVGVGRFRIRRGGLRIDLAAHRVAYSLSYSDPGGDTHLHRLCETPRCVRPDHFVIFEPVIRTGDNYELGIVNRPNNLIGSGRVGPRRKR